MTNNYPEYVNKIIPADVQDEMTDNREESITDFGIAVMGGTTQALTNTQATQASSIAEAIQDTILENPFNTASNQIVVSLSENCAARQMREGRPVHVKVANSAVVTTKSTITGLGTPTAGYIYHPKKILASCNQNALVNIKIVTGIVDAPATIEFPMYLLAKTPFLMTFDNEMYLIPGGAISVEVTPEADGLAQISTYGIEVAQNG